MVLQGPDAVIRGLDDTCINQSSAREHMTQPLQAKVMSPVAGGLLASAELDHYQL
jgi:hypothetical protein